MDRNERVAEMGAILNKHTDAVKAFKKALAAFDEAQIAYDKLDAYYSSKDWFDDVDAYDKGEITVDCGVLTEDAVYDLIGDNYEMAKEMIRVANSIFQKH